MKRIFIFGAVMVAVIVVFFLARSRNSASMLPPITVTRGELIQEVEATGKVKAAQSVDLSFERAGTIAAVAVKLGDLVKSGQELARQDRADLAVQLKQADAARASAAAGVLSAQANLEREQARLSELRNGTRPEQIEVTQSSLRKAENDLLNLFTGVFDLASRAYTVADDAVRVKSTGVFVGHTSQYSLSYLACDAQAETDATWLRFLANQELAEWKQSLIATGSSNDPVALQSLLDKTKKYLENTNHLLERTYDTLISECTAKNSTLDVYRTNMNAARSAVVGALGDANDRSQQLVAQRLVVERAQKQLDLEQAGTPPEQLAAQEARVRQARASLSAQEAKVQEAQANRDTIQLQISKTILRSPIDGIVTRVDAKKGMLATPGLVQASVLALSTLEVEVHVPEVDIGKIGVGKSAALTIDAFPGESFAGAVTFVDPAETVVDGVVHYRVVIGFDTMDDRVKSGMTVNVRMETQKKEGLLIPRAVLIQNDRGTFVRKVVHGVAQEMPVTVGLDDSRGSVEIISGLTEGDEIMPVDIKKRK